MSEGMLLVIRKLLYVVELSKGIYYKNILILGF